MFACCMTMTARLLLVFAWANACCSQVMLALLRSANSVSPSGERPRLLLLPGT
jgi:hypothetical protein